MQPTVHEPCLYVGEIDGFRVLFIRIVHDFAISTAHDRTAAILLDRVDDKLSIPIKRQGRIKMFNGLDIHQTRDYVKISCETYIDRIHARHSDKWMKSVHIASDRPTPLPTADQFMKEFLKGNGDPTQTVQDRLAEMMGLSY